MAGTKNLTRRRTEHKNRMTLLRVKTAKRAAVARYLVEHSELGSLIQEICAKARSTFGPHAELALELYRDRELPEEYLTLYIRQPRYAADVMDCIAGVVSEFLPRLDRASGHLLVTTDFRRPGA